MGLAILLQLPGLSCKWIFCFAKLIFIIIFIRECAIKRLSPLPTLPTPPHVAPPCALFYLGSRLNSSHTSSMLSSPFRCCRSNSVLSVFVLDFRATINSIDRNGFRSFACRPRKIEKKKSLWRFLLIKKTSNRFFFPHELLHRRATQTHTNTSAPAQAQAQAILLIAENKYTINDSDCLLHNHLNTILNLWAVRNALFLRLYSASAGHTAVWRHCVMIWRLVVLHHVPSQHVYVY